MKTFFSAIILISIILLTNSALAQTETKKPTADTTICEPDSLGRLVYYFPCIGDDFRASFKNFMSKHLQMMATIQPDLINNFYDKNNQQINNALEITGYYISLKPMDIKVRDY